jgi:hypothetical protein
MHADGTTRQFFDHFVNVADLSPQPQTGNYRVIPNYFVHQVCDMSIFSDNTAMIRMESQASTTRSEVTSDAEYSRFTLGTTLIPCYSRRLIHIPK